MKTKSPRDRDGSGDDSELASAAATLDAELQRYDDLAAELARVPLNSEKNLSRAARALTDAADSQTRASEHVAALVSAISAARERQQNTAQALLVRAQEIQKRVATLEMLLAVFAQLGRDAKEINGELQEATANRAAAGEAVSAQELIVRIGAIEGRMDRVVEQAKDLVALARQEDVVDVAERADSLRQQLHAARNKMKLFAQTLSKNAPN